MDTTGEATGDGFMQWSAAQPRRGRQCRQKLGVVLSGKKFPWSILQTRSGSPAVGVGV